MVSVKFSSQTPRVRSDVFTSDVRLVTGTSLAHMKAWRRAAAAGLVASNLVLALYTGLVHQRGVLDVMDHVRALCDVSRNSSVPQPDVLFLMPCHSTPFYRYDQLRGVKSRAAALQFVADSLFIQSCSCVAIFLYKFSILTTLCSFKAFRSFRRWSGHF